MRSLAGAGLLPDRRGNRTDLSGDPSIRFRTPVFLERENRRPAEFTQGEIAVRGDQFVVPGCRHGDNLTLWIDDDGMAEQFATVFHAGLGGGDGEAGVLVAAGLDRQVRVEDTEMMRLETAGLHV